MVVVVGPILTGPLEGSTDPDLFIAQTEGIVDANIDAKTDDDRIIGRNTSAGGAGIFRSNIDAGGDDDLVIGLATGADGVGIVGGLIELGSGNDTLIARGAEAGVQDVDIDGGGGDDRFNIDSGTGFIVGGTGDDELILDGESVEYEIMPIDDLFEIIQITGGPNDNTDLFVEKVELITFDDGSIEVDGFFA